MISHLVLGFILSNIVSFPGIISVEIGSVEAWRCCSPTSARTMQEEWSRLMDSLTVNDRVSIVEEIWRKLAAVSPIGARYLEAFYVGPLHLYPPEQHEVQRRRGYIGFLAKQGLIIQLLAEPAVLWKDIIHFQSKLKVQKRPDTVKHSPEAGWEQLTLLFEEVFLETMSMVAPSYSAIAWEGCFRTMRMLVAEATPVRKSYYGKCIIRSSTGIPDQNITGAVVFEQKVGEERTTIKVDIDGFNPTDGEVDHGFHIHSVGETGNQCKDAGGHYNPRGVSHGGPTADERHIGDLGNVKEEEFGSVHMRISDHQALLLGQESIFGKSVVVHAKTDDFGLGGHADSKATGHAGARLGCCVIQFAPEMMTMDD